ncbi:MAG: sarcosine oxidase subunit delta [Pseudomonadota bacterium]
MLLITCPVCGIEGDEADFHAGGQAHVLRPQSKDPSNVSETELSEYLYVRDNPKGLHRELWHCGRGCNKWFNAERDTVTMEFKGFYKIGEKPPSEKNAKKKGGTA